MANDAKPTPGGCRCDCTSLKWCHCTVVRKWCQALRQSRHCTLTRDGRDCANAKRGGGKQGQRALQGSGKGEASSWAENQQ
eukprot:675683-Alexandrium_andersonii.AAC.1